MRKILKLILLCNILLCNALLVTSCGLNRSDQTTNQTNNSTNDNTNNLSSIDLDKIDYITIENYNEDEGIQYTYTFDFTGSVPTASIRMGNEVEFDEVSDVQKSEVIKLVTDYMDTVEAGRDNYWPQTEEYSDMANLFSFEVESGNDKYFCDGALTKPEGYDDFCKQIEYLVFIK